MSSTNLPTKGQRISVNGRSGKHHDNGTVTWVGTTEGQFGYAVGIRWDGNGREGVFSTGVSTWSPL